MSISLSSSSSSYSYFLCPPLYTCPAGHSREQVRNKIELRRTDTATEVAKAVISPIMLLLYETKKQQHRGPNMPQRRQNKVRERQESSHARQWFQAV